MTEFPWPSYEDVMERRETEEKTRRLTETLAESTVSDVGQLRLALANIVVRERGMKTYVGGCVCSGGEGCSGHVTDSTKLARAGLGLPELPDRPQVEKPPALPKKPRKKKARVCAACGASKSGGQR